MIRTGIQAYEQKAIVGGFGQPIALFVPPLRC
jgi:hypothetical protein